MSQHDLGHSKLNGKAQPNDVADDGFTVQEPSSDTPVRRGRRINGETPRRQMDGRPDFDRNFHGAARTRHISGTEAQAEVTRLARLSLLEYAQTRAAAAKLLGLLAGLGRLPGTLDDRSIIIFIQKRRRGDQCEPITKATEELAVRLARQIARWVSDNRQALAEADPDMGVLYNRPADLWRPLYAIADLAGDSWPELVRLSQAVLAGNDDDEAKPLGVRLLTDVRAIFAAAAPVTELATASLVGQLNEMQDRPWPEMPGTAKPLTAAKFTRTLGKFGITRRRLINPETKRAGDWGYRLADFQEAFARYLDA
jgi:hypothetical protein